MSGGFFRGTSADQDTRFSNKQAKHLKSQKFPPELDRLVDITKVNMDVMKPWIARRVTELLEFEDEVLINFIYGLLDGKQVNGKEVQISLTGFMEKNTGKFMKELWQLLLSAQNNASGVPQQLLDAKEGETRKKQIESESIKSEMQKKKEEEGREIKEQKVEKLDGETGMKRTETAILEPRSKRNPEASDDEEKSARNGIRGKSSNRRSRSLSKSYSNSGSYSGERRKSRGISRSPPRGRSISSERAHHSRLRSISDCRKYSRSRSTSPPIRRSAHSRRRSTSRSRRTSPSPIWRRMRSPETYRSRSPFPRRSLTPIRHRSRSPPRYRSRLPVRRRYASPLRRRSPSPVRRRYHRSPSTPPCRSPSPRPCRSSIHNRRRSPPPSRYRSHSQEALTSSPDRRLSPSPVKKRSPRSQRSPVRSPREKTRAYAKSSPVRNARHRGSIENSDEICEGSGPAVQWPSVSLRSPQRDTRAVGHSHRKAASSSPSPQKSQIHLKSPADSRRRSSSKGGRSPRPYKSLVVQSKERKVRDARASSPQNPRDQKHRHDSPEPMIKKEELDRVRNNGNQKLKPSERCSNSSKPDTHKDFEIGDGKHDYSEKKAVGRHSSETGNRSDGMELGKEELESRSEKTSMKVLHPEDSDKGKVPAIYEDSQKADEKIQPLSDEAKYSKRLKKTDKSTIEVDEKSGSGSLNSGSDGSLKHRKCKDCEYRKRRRSGKKEVTSVGSSDSEMEDRKIAKRRKKEEKRSRKEKRKEERCRRREERHRIRKERRTEKLKAKLNDGSTAEETVSEQKKLEIELREKALESLRAKKDVGH